MWSAISPHTINKSIIRIFITDIFDEPMNINYSLIELFLKSSEHYMGLDLSGELFDFNDNPFFF